MFEAIKVTSGYTSKLPCIKDRVFVFSNGLNVLFGGNGSGKSSLIKILGAYSCTTGGWSRIKDNITPSIFRKGKSVEESLPGLLHLNSQCQAKVAWNGTASFLHQASESDSFPVAFGMSDCLSEVEEISMVVRKPSQGEMRLFKLNKILKGVGKIPDLTKLPKCRYNSVWMGAMKKVCDYVSSLPRTGIVTLLLDEPDRSLSIENQVLLWKLLPEVAKKCQIIVAI